MVKCRTKNCMNDVVVYPSGNEGTFCQSCIDSLQKQSKQMNGLLRGSL